MGARSHIAKWGSSLAVWIPKPVAEQWGVREGSRIEMIPRGDRLVMRRKAYDLETILDRITPETLHSEVDTGSAVGDEVW